MMVIVVLIGVQAALGLNDFSSASDGPGGMRTFMQGVTETDTGVCVAQFDRPPAAVAVRSALLKFAVLHTWSLFFAVVLTRAWKRTVCLVLGVNAGPTLGIVHFTVFGGVSTPPSSGLMLAASMVVVGTTSVTRRWSPDTRTTSDRRGS